MAKKQRGNPEIWKLAKGFDKNPQNINKKGRPKKSFNKINEFLKKRGVEPLMKPHLIEAYSLILNSDQESLQKIKEDPSTPVAFVAIIDELEDKNTRMRAMQDYRDYMFGKAAHVTEHKFTEQPLFDFTKLGQLPPKVDKVIEVQAETIKIEK